MSTPWFLKIDEKESGPFSGRDLRAKADAGMIGKDDLVRKGTDGNWVRASRISGLFEPAAVKGTSNPSEASTTPRNDCKPDEVQRRQAKESHRSVPEAEPSILNDVKRPKNEVDAAFVDAENRPVVLKNTPHSVKQLTKPKPSGLSSRLPALPRSALLIALAIGGVGIISVVVSLAFFGKGDTSPQVTTSNEPNTQAISKHEIAKTDVPQPIQQGVAATLGTTKANDSVGTPESTEPSPANPIVPVLPEVAPPLTSTVNRALLVPETVKTYFFRTANDVIFVERGQSHIYKSPGEVLMLDEPPVHTVYCFDSDRRLVFASDGSLKFGDVSLSVSAKLAGTGVQQNVDGKFLVSEPGIIDLVVQVGDYSASVPIEVKESPLRFGENGATKKEVLATLGEPDEMSKQKVNSNAYLMLYGSVRIRGPREGFFTLETLEYESLPRTVLVLKESVLFSIATLKSSSLLRADVLELISAIETPSYASPK
jgi:hypothetical protein